MCNNNVKTDAHRLITHSRRFFMWGFLVLSCFVALTLAGTTEAGKKYLYGRDFPFFFAFFTRNRCNVPQR